MLQSVGVVVAASILGSCSSTPVALAPGNAVLFEGARLIVGDDNAPIENAALLVENRRFTKVGRKGEISGVPAGREVDRAGLRAKWQAQWNKATPTQ